MPNLPMRLWTIHRVEGNVKLTTIGELQPNKTYTVSVLAYNSVGDGPRSEKKQVMTRQGGQYAPALPHARCADSSLATAAPLCYTHVYARIIYRVYTATPIAKSRAFLGALC